MSIYDYKAKLANGDEVSLSNYKGKVCLIVNVASQCGFTPQYSGLESLYETFQAKGLEVLAFPCNQFGKQEPGNNKEIVEFCETNFNIKFPIFEKVDVNGEHTHPLYQHLKSSCPGVFGTEAIKWNFTKFLVNRDGEVVKRYAPKDTPESIQSDIEDLL